MKAWEIDKALTNNAKPRLLSEEEQTWDAIEKLELDEDRRIRMFWYSEVPGSAAPERLVVAAVQDMENRGMKVDKAEALIPEALAAFEAKDMVKLHRITSDIFRELYLAERDTASPYWQYAQYDSWEQFEAKAGGIDAMSYDIFDEAFEKQIYAGWMTQIIGGALGTALECYTTSNLKDTFGEIRGYVRKPNTFNDDITYELAFLKAFEKKGLQVSSSDIAREWVAYIPFGWSAEDVALRNIKQGIYPPESGCFNNPFREWIGAQMRGAICGMAAPGNPMEAARLAWIDGVISHHNNGVLGEIFNAVMVSLAFVRTDIRGIVKAAAEMIPKDSEYRSVIEYALQACHENAAWEKAWQLCEKHFEKYNWVHAYPNAAAEVVALWYGNGDFDETMHIVAMAGQDVDCNAAQIATVLGIAGGMASIGNQWTEPVGDLLNTYVREMKVMGIKELSRWTVEVIRQAYKKGV